MITQFLDRAIRNRISLRLTAEQHISLSAASVPHLLSSSSSSSSTSTDLAPAAEQQTEAGTPNPNRVGILDLALSPVSMVQTCAEYVTLLCDSTYGVCPRFCITSSPSPSPSSSPSSEILVGSIGSHLEYILTELLKNAARATVEYHTPKREEVEEGVFRFEDTPHHAVDSGDLPEVKVVVGVVKGVMTVRIRDRGGGVRKFGGEGGASLGRRAVS